MVLDKTAIDHLQIFEVDEYSKEVKGSLFDLFKCSFIFGRRLLRNWIAAPLCNKEKLEQRHDSVEFLVNNYVLVQRFRKEMKSSHDLEKCLQNIYKFWVASESRAVYVKVNLQSHLNYFYILIEQFEKIIQKLEKIFPNKSIIKAKRLKSLLTFNSKDRKTDRRKRSKMSSDQFTITTNSDSEPDVNEVDLDRSDGGILPDIRDEIFKFRSVVRWKNKMPEPAPGFDSEFDAAAKAWINIENDIDGLLIKAQKEIGSDLIEYYKGSKYYRYEINVPKRMIKKFLKHLSKHHPQVLQVGFKQLN